MMRSLVKRGSTTEIIRPTESVCSEDRRVCGLYSECVRISLHRTTVPKSCRATVNTMNSLCYATNSEKGRKQKWCKRRFEEQAEEKQRPYRSVSSVNYLGSEKFDIVEMASVWMMGIEGIHAAANCADGNSFFL